MERAHIPDNGNTEKAGTTVQNSLKTNVCFQHATYCMHLKHEKGLGMHVFGRPLSHDS